MRAASATIALGLAACAFDPTGQRSQTTDGSPDDPDSGGGAVDAREIDAPGPTPVIDAPCPDLDRDGTCDPDDGWDCGPTAPVVNFPAVAGAGRIQNTAVGILASPVEQLAPGEFRSLSVDVGAARTGAYRIGEAGGRFLGCRNGTDLIPATTWLQPVSLTAGSTVSGTAIALVYQHTQSCGTGWMGPAPTEPIIGYYCVRNQ